MEMKEITELTHADIEKIKLLVFDVDGVLVPRGTRIEQKDNWTTYETKVIAEKQIDQITSLYNRNFYMNISSGRGLFMLQEMFRSILSCVSLTYENGSATWFEGRIIQHINSYEYLREIYPILRQVKDSKIKGFEPKEFIITIHCEEQVKEIEEIVARFPQLYTVWNGEAYDIGIKDTQTKATGLRVFREELNLQKENVLAIGDNYNDKELLDEAGIAVTADKSRVEGHFYIPLQGKYLPADVLMDQILRATS